MWRLALGEQGQRHVENKVPRHKRQGYNKGNGGNYTLRSFSTCICCPRYYCRVPSSRKDMYRVPPLKRIFTNSVT